MRKQFTNLRGGSFSALSVLLASCGYSGSSGRQITPSERSQLRDGMTQHDVLALFGEPGGKHLQDAETELWMYTYCEVSVGPFSKGETKMESMQVRFVRGRVDGWTGKYSESQPASRVAPK